MLQPVGQSTRAIIRSLHLLSVTAWLGGGMGVLLLLALDAHTAGSSDLAAYSHVITCLDNWLIRPGAAGAAVTGMFICLLTPWGFTRHRWVVVKWSATLLALAIGGLWLEECLQELAALADAMPVGFTGDLAGSRPFQLGSLIASLQTLLLFGLVLISTWKPRLGSVRLPKATPRSPQGPAIHHHLSSR